MEDSLTKQIETSKDENIIITRNLVDRYIVKFKLTFSQDERDDMIMKVLHLIQKKYIAPNVTTFEANKGSIIKTIVVSYIGSVKIGKPNIR